MLFVVMFGKKSRDQGGFLPRWPCMALLLWLHLSIEVQLALGSGETQQHHGSVLATWHSAEMVGNRSSVCFFSQKMHCSFVGTFNCLVCCFAKRWRTE